MDWVFSLLGWVPQIGGWLARRRTEKLAWRISDFMRNEAARNGGNPTHYVFREEFIAEAMKTRLDSVREALLWLRDKRLV